MNTTEISPREYLRRMRSSAVYNVAVRSPLDLCPVLSRRLGNRVLLKREDQQPVFSFKLRGAYNMMARLDASALEQGVVAASAGNHAQGVALAAQHLGAHAVIVVPRTAPEIKQEAIRRLGAELVLHGDSYDEAYAHARQLERERGLTFVHPYDHPDVIAGQGTVGLEIDEQHSGRIDAVFVPVGGGGLVAGVALALKQLRPDVKIVGVEPEDSDALHRSLAADERITLERVGLFADGVAVRTPGEETFRIARDWVDAVEVVSNDAICAAVKEIFEDRRAVLEPAGALAYAGLRSYAERLGLREHTLIAIASGANLNFDRLRTIAERAQIGEQHEAVLAVTIPERPGAFRQLCGALGDRSVTEFNYRMGNADEAAVFVGIQVRDSAERAALIDQLSEGGYASLDLTDDEIAKTHVRHMVGGRCAAATNERVFHFDFPERTGALAEFLDRLHGAWNISLFHYRNHGAERGRVLCGIQVPPETNAAFNDFLAEVGYGFTEQTDSQVLRLFLGR
ncbi:threonine ammonia-lyase, biosynthetic [Fimbriimonas ginsengisoli]|uniref:L-threonine dehydratase n=1 Tax=Fimbriimonas ginsengisoli Gsoil 348 TaxID=661478 RepID=A0A068NPT5_FIMGI|nr:threonine ammonia-lyase, biosynthetic [Fimbriimonas ginsengisoli]AIE83584.1 threonine dehydratase [Fimbriimonas ginsengisoli Gsoil 348]